MSILKIVDLLKGGPGSGRHKGVAPGVHEALSAKGYKHEWASSDNKEHRYQHSNGNTVTHQFHGGSASYTNIYGSRMNLLAQPRNNDQLKSKLNEIHGFKKGGPGSGRHNEGKWVQATTKPYVHPKQHKALTDRGYKFVRTVPAQKDPNGTGYHTYKAGTDASEGKFIHVLNTGGVVPSKNEFLKGGPGSGRHASEDRKGGSGYSELSGHQNNDAAHKILLQHGFRHVATHEALPNGNTTDVYHKPDHKVSVTSNGYISHEDYKNTAIHEFKGKTGPAQLDKHLSSFKKGGAGSGNHGHSGRPGSVGGSGGGGVKSSPGNKKDRRNNLKRGVGKANAKLGKANDALKNGETDKANGHLKEVSGHVQDSLHGIAVSGKAKSQYQIQEAMKRNKEIASGLRNPHEKYHSELAHGNHLKEAAANLGELVKLIAEHTKHTLVH